ncbi:MAG: phosphatidate cytidylyltransferase [Robiginitomaculum sp.]|nr:MAG: phosphatidate cytidylyltransferase [Robiginitomaculum sp.]
MDEIVSNSTKPGTFKSLGVRAVSGITLILICGLPVYYGGWAMIVLVAFFGTGMIWEWVRMTDAGFSKLAVILPILGLLGVLGFAGIGYWAWAVGVVLGASVLATLERVRRGEVLWAGAGVIYILMPCLAIIWLRGQGAGVSAPGFAKLLFVIFVVIAADSFAYLGGSTLKGPKFAPKISPNKTWSGFASGLIGGGIVGMIVAWFSGMSPLYGLVFSVPVVLASVFGDLLESAIKRHLDVKDAGDLLPGHGGLLDRVDSLMMAVLIAVIALLVWPDFFSTVWSR